METPVGIGEVLAGKYRVERVLGTGGMGVVVSAWHLELDQRVALKFLHRFTDERGDAAERFRREARALAKIRSEHVARVFDVNTLETGVRYMVMEFLQGHDLGEELRTRGRFGVVEAVDCILPAIEAIAEAHAMGIVHRDLKPANLFLAQRADGSSLIKVLDFGVSKSLLGSGSSPGDKAGKDVSITQAATLIGSPLYMPPEQMRSARDVDQRADIWALGAILYELIAGTPPYVGETISELVTAVHNDEPLPLSTYRDDIPPGIEPVILRCLAKERSGRWPTVANLASALAPFGSPGSALHVQRACRVLNVGTVTPSGTIALPPSTQVPRIRLTPTLDSSDRSFRVDSVHEQTREEATQTAWAHTSNKSRTPQLLAAFGLLLALAAGTAVFVRSRPEPQSSDQKVPIPAPAVVPAQTLPAEQPPSAPTVAIAPPEPSASSTTSEAPDGSAPPPTMTPASRVAAPRTPRTSRTSKAESAPDKAPDSSSSPRPDNSQGVTNFGGRH